LRHFSPEPKVYGRGYRFKDEQQRETAAKDAASFILSSSLLLTLLPEVPFVEIIRYSLRLSFM